MKELIGEKAQELGVEIQALEVMPDYVHLLVAVPPTDAPQFFANQFKGFMFWILREEFPHLKSTLTEVIKKYIADQKVRS